MKEYKIEDVRSVSKSISCKEALKAIITLNNVILQYKNTTPQLITDLEN